MVSLWIRFADSGEEEELIVQVGDSISLVRQRILEKRLFGLAPGRKIFLTTDSSSSRLLNREKITHEFNKTLVVHEEDKSNSKKKSAKKEKEKKGVEEGGEDSDKDNGDVDKKEESEKEKKEVDLTQYRDLLKEDFSTLSLEEQRDYTIIKRLLDWQTETGTRNLVVSTVFLANVPEINSLNGTLSVEINFQLFWFDKDLIGKEGGPEEWGIDDYWKPEIEFVNGVDIESSEPSYTASYPRYGLVNWYQKYTGTVKMKQDLKDFPFDSQHVVIKFGTCGWNADEVSIEDVTSERAKNLFQRGIDLTEWDLVQTPVVRGVEDYNYEDERYISNVELHLFLKRKSRFYLSHVVSLVFLCDMMLWSIYAVSPDDVAGRTSLAITLYLALVALNFSISFLLPKVSYSTKLVQYFVKSYAFISLTCIQSVISYAINKYYCNVPSGEDACWTALYFDWVTVGVIVFSQVMYTLFFLYLGNRITPKFVVQPTRTIRDRLKTKIENNEKGVELDDDEETKEKKPKKSGEKVNEDSYVLFPKN